ncbi:hypothetical protein [Bacillus sp. NH11B]|uniref:hypothetical protein n=1 Tax=Bacillus sp. NH11B TaxID=1866314 RepID=UPI0008FE567F|nr:hypothetical protein [Bacillus sp. NH11B]OJD62313.1 hypothetical protein BAU27_11610 [Bacillus sp. NH11B]
MLKKLLEKGVTLGLFELKPLKDLDGSCASSANLEVIDYDLVKEKVYEIMNSNGMGIKFQIPKSCDALKILPNEDRLDFIEIKGIKTFCEKLAEREGCNAQREMDKQVKKFSLSSKIEDSLDLFKSLLKMDRFEITNAEKEAILGEIHKNYLVVIDEEVEQDYAMRLAAGLEFLSTTSNYKSEMVIKLQDTIDGINIAKISKPILLCHSQVDAYYESVLGVAN